MTKPKKKPTKMTTKKRIRSSSDAPDVETLRTVAAEEETTATGEKSDAGESAPTDERPSGEPTEKRGRGRPKGSKTRAPAGMESAVPEILVRAVVRIPYTIAAGQYGKHWELTDAELDNMVPLHVQLAQEYMPDFLKEHPALYGCLFLHALAIIGRVSISKRLEEESKKPVDPEEDIPLERSADLPGKTRFGEVVQAPSGFNPGTPGSTL